MGGSAVPSQENRRTSGRSAKKKGTISFAVLVTGTSPGRAGPSVGGLEWDDLPQGARPDGDIPGKRAGVGSDEHQTNADTCREDP